MPRALHTSTPLAAERRPFDWTAKLITTVISMLAMLIVTGIVSTVSLYSRVTALTDSVAMIQQQIVRSVDHTVDRDDYLRRDTQIQRAIDSMATKDELRVMQHQLDEQTESLRIIEGAVSSRVKRRAEQ